MARYDVLFILALPFKVGSAELIAGLPQAGAGDNMRFARCMLILIMLLLLTLNCYAQSELRTSARFREVFSRIHEPLEKELAAKDLELGAPIYLRIFKSECSWKYGCKRKAATSCSKAILYALTVPKGWAIKTGRGMAARRKVFTSSGQVR